MRAWWIDEKIKLSSVLLGVSGLGWPAENTQLKHTGIDGFSRTRILPTNKHDFRLLLKFTTIGCGQCSASRFYSTNTWKQITRVVASLFSSDLLCDVTVRDSGWLTVVRAGRWPPSPPTPSHPGPGLSGTTTNRTVHIYDTTCKHPAYVHVQHSSTCMYA